MPEIIRSFIAVDVPPEVARKIASAKKFFESRNFKGVSEKNIHLTLKFLGNVEKELLDELATALRDALKEEKPFRFEIEGFGAFPDESRARVVWCGVKNGSQELLRLASRIDEAALKFGFRPEAEFVPHITIGRFRKPENISSRIKQLEEESDIKSIVEVNSLQVYRSTLTREGPIYEVLYRIALTG